MSKKRQFISIFVISLLLFGCKGSTKNYRVDFIDRHSAFFSDQKQKPLRLIVEIKENDKLSLNKIETGTIDDLTDLTKRIEAIFGDREKSGINEREVVIDPHGIESEKLDKLIECLAKAEADPIRVIKDNF